MEIPGLPTEAKFALVDVFMTNSKADHYSINLGRDADDGGTTWVSGGGRPSSSFSSQSKDSPGVHMTYFGDSDGHSSHYGLWYSSMIVSTNGAQLYMHRDGNGAGGTGWTYLRVHAYGY